ncbi:MAG: RDD family protein, partial [Pseudoalteromonas spongiae]
WCKGDQTIGMRAWRLKVRNLDGTQITKPQALIRAITALLGLGNLLVLVDFKNKRSLQDYLAKTEVITLSKEENKKVYRELD